MAQLNGTDQFSNITNPNRIFCTGPEPSKILRITTYSILIICTLVGNMLIVAVFYRKRTLRTPVHYFIANMAISDLIIPVINLPWRISNAYSDGLWLIDGILGTVLCKLVWISWSVSNFVSIFSMITIAADRFHAILFPLKPALFSRNKCRMITIIIAATWIVSVASRAHYLYGARLVKDNTRLYCYFQWEPASHRREVSKITWITVVCLTSLSAIVLTVLYSSIAIFLCRQKNNLHLASEVIRKRAKRNRKITFMLVIVVIVFYAVWIPHHVLYYIFHLKRNIILPCSFVWLEDSVIPLSYPVINSLVYYIFNKDYNEGFRELLCCPWPFSNKCNDCFRSSVSPQGENNVHNDEQVNNAVENIELQEQ